MNESAVPRENCRLHRRTIRIGKTAIKRNVDDIFKGKLNLIRLQSVGEPIKRLMQSTLKFVEDSHDFVNSRLVHQSTGPPDKQANLFVKVCLRWKVHRISVSCTHAIKPPAAPGTNWGNAMDAGKDRRFN